MAFSEKEQAFLRELTALSRKHGVIVDGCGCCGSPFLHERDCSDPDEGYGSGNSDVEWIAKDRYRWHENEDTIVK